MKSSERAGILFAVAGFIVLSIGDAVIKSMADAWPAVAVAALRFTIGAIALSALLARAEGTAGFVPQKPWLQAARGICLALATLAFFSAIYVMPLAEAMAIAFIAPVLTQVFGGLVLGEKVRRIAWFVSLLALAGVAVVLRPNLAELGWAAFLPLISATFFALMIIANRASAGQGSALSMQFFIAAVAAPVLILAATAAKLSGLDAFDFGWPRWDVVLRCAIVAFTATTAHWLVYLGTQRAGASQVAPASYVQLLVAIALGWWWFDDTPDLPTFFGASMIIGAGLILWRDTQNSPAERVK